MRLEEPLCRAWAQDLCCSPAELSGTKLVEFVLLIRNTLLRQSETLSPWFLKQDPNTSIFNAAYIFQHGYLLDTYWFEIPFQENNFITDPQTFDPPCTSHRMLPPQSCTRLAHWACAMGVCPMLRCAPHHVSCFSSNVNVPPAVDAWAGVVGIGESPFSPGLPGPDFALISRQINGVDAPWNCTH